MISIKKLEFENYYKYLNLHKNGFCKFCHWCEEYNSSHIEHACYNCILGCKYIWSMYDLSRDDDGELIWELKKNIILKK
jgi:hypothetical protein